MPVDRAVDRPRARRRPTRARQELHAPQGHERRASCSARSGACCGCPRPRRPSSSADAPGDGRDDDHQHGAAAPQHPRRAAPHARARGRDRAAHQADHRLPAHRHGEDGRGPHLPPGPHQRHPHGLRLAALQRAGRSAMAAEKLLGIDDDIPDRATWIRMLMCELNRISSPPAVPRHQRHGHRRGVDDALRLARARGGAPRSSRRSPACG